jgi:hypothetical protein
MATINNSKNTVKLAARSCIGMIKDVFESAFQEKPNGLQQELDKTIDPKAPRRYDKSSVS